MTRRLSAVPDPPPDALDVCDGCGHTYTAHRGGRSCIAWAPARALKGVDYRGHPIDVVTATIVATSAQGRVHDPGSSVCPCARFRPSGRRVVVPVDVEEARRVREGRARRTVKPIGEL